MQRWQDWKEQTGLNNANLRAARLAEDALTEEALLALLDESEEALQQRSSAIPAWLNDLMQLLAHAAFAQEVPPDARFAQCLWPLVAAGVRRLRASIALLMQESPSLPIDPETFVAARVLDLAGQLHVLASRTMALELHVARLQGQLLGESAHARFLDFVRSLQQQENLLPLLQEYAVMARLVTTTIDQWADYTDEFLRHLRQDWPQLCETFFPGQDPGLLLEGHTGAGDLHRGGRSVMILHFASGLKLVYKPRSVALDVHFQQLLHWLNARGDHPPFRLLRLLERGTYGWSEFVRAQSCSEPEEMIRFYERLGAYLALLYALEATDFHYENLIAAGEQPLLIDLEALFHPRIEGAMSAEASPGSNALKFSVLRVGLLPLQIMLNKDLEGVDLSGIGGQDGQQTPWPVPLWQDSGTDQMRLVRQKSTIIGTENRPMLKGVPVDPLAHRADLLRGFTSLYRLLMAHRQALIAGPLASFAHDETRLILRPTQVYADLLIEGSHPDVLRDALERDLFFDHLWAPVQAYPHLARVIPYERRDLHMGDIPLFLTTPGSSALVTSRGEILPDFLASPGGSAVEKRLECLDEQDLQRQIWLIQASLATLAQGNPHAARGSSRLKPARTQAGPAQFLAAARAVGDRLSSLAFCEAGQVSWVGLSLVNERRWALLPVGNDLYDGAAGIILFLSYLGALTHEARYTALARQAFSSQKARKEPGNTTPRRPGAFDGLGSTIYLLAHLGSLWQEPALWDEAEEMAGQLPALIAQDHANDIISGAAGCLLVLLGLYRVRPAATVREVACLCGEHLLAQARQMETGLAWETLKEVTGPLTGFSHGAAGIGLSLLALSDLTGAEHLRQAARRAMHYERSLFSPRQQNWPDLRTPPPAETVPEAAEQLPPTMTAWCHGAAGIGLGRLAALRYLDEPEIREEIAVAVATTIERGFGFNHSLCHGDLGNLETVLLASRVLPTASLDAHLKRLSAMILESMQAHGWRTGAPLGIQTPGLMTGLAGIGYQCLRLAAPARVPLGSLAGCALRSLILVPGSLTPAGSLPGIAHARV
jgi:type 2 lantibiotic biosynthesis protein LanM